MVAFWGALLVAPTIVERASAQNFLEEAGQFEGKVIKEVTIRYREVRTVDEARLRSHMSTRVGKAYSQTMLDDDTRTLYETGLVDDVQWFAQEVEGGVKVSAEMVTRPLVSGLGFSGNVKFSDTKLAKETDIGVGQILSDAQIIKARKKIEEFYLGYGYPDIEVSHRLQATGRPGYADLIFVIGEGEKSEIDQIRFEGNDTLSEAELRKEMKTKEKGWFSWFDKSGRLDSVALDEDLVKLEDYYRSQGYWRATVGVPRREQGKKGRVDLVIPVTEGPKYVVDSVSFPDIKVFTSEELNPALSLIGGMPYSSQKVRDDIRMIRSYYGSRGYADASVVPDVRELDGARVSLAYRITPGTRVNVGRVNIQGNTKSQDRVIRREVPMRPGENFNSVDLETTKRRLQNLNYFSDVQVSGAKSTQSGYRDVNVLVSEKQTGSINFGLGLSSIDNIVGFVNFEQTNFDIREPFNFRGGGAGQRFSTSLRAGTERKDFRLSFVEPWFLGRKLSLGTEMFYRDLLYLSDEYDQTNLGGAVFLRSPIGRKAYLKAEYRFENIEVDVEADSSPAFQAEDGEYLRSALSLNYVYDSRDSNKLPRRGHKVDVGLSFAGSFLGGDVDTYTISTSGTKHWNLAWDTILTARGEFSTVDEIGGDGAVPIFERQFLGGSRDLRGFEYRDIGPRDPASKEVLGGGTSAFASLELTIPITEMVRGAVFYDMGFVNEGSWDLSATDLASDAGVGLRLDLPIGPLAVDYALPLTTPDEESDKNGQFNFYLNYQF